MNVEYDVFLEACKKYHETEPRAITYVITRSLVKDNPQFKKEAVRLLLADWNRRQTQKYGDKRLTDDIKSAFEELEKIKEKNSLVGNLLTDKLFENLNLKNQESDEARAIEKVFKIFWRRNSIRYVGASKTLGLLNPEVFVMWDNEIAKEMYGCYNLYMDYLKFMRKVKEKFVPLLKKHSVKKMWKDHFLQLNKRDQDFYSRLSFRETFPKMIDEFNYYIIHNAPAKLRSRVLR